MTSRIFTALLRSFACAVMARDAQAHMDPLGCSTLAPVLNVEAFRADGLTPIALADQISPCEIVLVRLFLAKRNADEDCAFQGGRLLLTTPNGRVIDLTPADGIPCLGG